MSDATSFSKLGYLMLKKESAAGTAIYPVTPVELLSENIKTNWDFTAVTTIAQNRSMNMRPVKNKVGPFEGTLEFYVEPNLHGHFLCGLFGEDTHTTITAGVSEVSDFQPLTTIQSYTMDIKEGGEDYVRRYFGVRIKKITYSLDENKLKASIDVTAQRCFTNARVTLAASSGTALLVDQTSGLVAGSDTIQVLSAAAPSTVLATLTVTTVTDELTLVVSTIGASLAANDIVVIKAQTIDEDNYDLSGEFIWSGGAEVSVGNGANALQALAAKTNCESFELTIENDIEPRWAATGADVVDRMPSAMLLKGVTVSGKFSQFHTNPEFMDMLRQQEQVGLRFKFLGAALAANTAASATGVVESDGTGTVTVTVTATGEAGNDYAIIVVLGSSSGAATASLAGKLITLTLSTTPASNAVATIATLLDALANVTAVAASTGNVGTVDNDDKIYFANGRDASEVEMLRFDLPNVRLMPFDANLGEDAVMQEDIDFTAFRDSNDEREVHVRLRNDITAF